MKTQIQVNVYKSVELDDYEKGCLLEGGSDFGCIDTFKTNSMNEALELIKSYGEPSIFDDRIDVQKMENGDGNEPMEYQIEEWKKGNRKMYLANYTFYFSEVTTKSLKQSDLVKAFPNVENNS